MQRRKNGIPIHDPSKQVNYKKPNGVIQKIKKPTGTYVELLKGNGEWAHVPFPSKDHRRLLKDGYVEVERWEVKKDDYISYTG